MAAPMVERDEIIALARQGNPPREIAARMGLDANTVSCLLSYERRKGAPIPYFPTGPGRIGRTRFVICDPPAGLREALAPHAAARGMSISELAGALLLAITRDDLVDAVLDDGGADG